jgi:hypothetical protein
MPLLPVDLIPRPSVATQTSVTMSGPSCLALPLEVLKDRADIDTSQCRCLYVRFLSFGFDFFTFGLNCIAQRLAA